MVVEILKKMSEDSAKVSLQLAPFSKRHLPKGCTKKGKHGGGGAYYSKYNR